MFVLFFFMTFQEIANSEKTYLMHLLLPGFSFPSPCLSLTTCTSLSLLHYLEKTIRLQCAKALCPAPFTWEKERERKKERKRMNLLFLGIMQRLLTRVSLTVMSFNFELILRMNRTSGSFAAWRFRITKSRLPLLRSLVQQLFHVRRCRSVYWSVSYLQTGEKRFFWVVGGFSDQISLSDVTSSNLLPYLWHMGSHRILTAPQHIPYCSCWHPSVKLCSHSEKIAAQ